MQNYEAAARILAHRAGTTFSIESVKTRRRKMPVQHIRITFDAVLAPSEVFETLAV